MSSGNRLEPIQPASVRNSRPDALVLEHYYPDGELGPLGLAQIAATFRHVFDLGIRGGVLGVDSAASRILVDEAYEAELLRAGDVVNLVGLDQTATTGSYPFGDLFRPAASHGLSLQTYRWWVEFHDNDDLLLFAGSNQEEIEVFSELARYQSLALVAVEDGAAGQEVARAIAERVDPERAFFVKTLGSTVCMPLALISSLSKEA